jgi:HAD superfamily hydrolase (TIGR01509 family)
LLEKNLKFLPGVTTLIKKARIKGIKLAIATATSMINVKSLFKTCWEGDVHDIFNVVVTGDMVKEKKPAPEAYKIVLDELNLEPDRCIAVEDSLNGLLSAKAAGLRVIITPSFYTKDDNFSKADLVLSSLSDFKIEG